MELRIASIFDFQKSVAKWALTCFGYEESKNTQERFFRFGEEALELLQAGGVTREHLAELIDQVYNKPPGELKQEIGGVSTTLAALCESLDIDLEEAAVSELDLIWERMDIIREKHKNKIRGSAKAGIIPNGQT